MNYEQLYKQLGVEIKNKNWSEANRLATILQKMDDEMKENN